MLVSMNLSTQFFIQDSVFPSNLLLGFPSTHVSQHFSFKSWITFYKSNLCSLDKKTCYPYGDYMINVLNLRDNIVQTSVTYHETRLISNSSLPFIENQSHRLTKQVPNHIVQDKFCINIDLDKRG